MKELKRVLYECRSVDSNTLSEMMERLVDMASGFKRLLWAGRISDYRHYLSNGDETTFDHLYTLWLYYTAVIARVHICQH